MGRGRDRQPRERRRGRGRQGGDGPGRRRRDRARGRGDVEDLARRGAAGRTRRRLRSDYRAEPAGPAPSLVVEAADAVRVDDGDARGLPRRVRPRAHGPRTRPRRPRLPARGDPRRARAPRGGRAGGQDRAVDPGLTPTRATRRRLLEAAGGGAAVLALALAVGWVASEATSRVANWFVMTDELFYERLAIAVAQTGSVLPRIHGHTVTNVNQLYPVLISLVYGNGDVGASLESAHRLNA